MSTQSWDISELQMAAAAMARTASQLNGLANGLAEPNPAMYGQLVIHAAEHAEPATTASHRDFLNALSWAVDSIGGGLDESANLYQQVEQANTQLADQLLADINALFN